jgi:diguanylate cyclase (GGDEF)-like protein
MVGHTIAVQFPEVTSVPPPVPGTQAQLAGRTVLVVDDDAANARFIREGLAAFGYRFVEARNGEEALARIRESAPDLVILDIEMPRMNGLELVRIVKGTRAFGFIPVILMTARASAESKISGLELGADDYLIKPVSILELAARAKSMLRLKVLHDDLAFANRRLVEINGKLQELSMTDPLTGLYNRLYFHKRFGYEFQRAERYRTPLACAMIDVDHFKRVNDTMGHPFGDLVLKEASKRIRNTLRQVDLVARYGGEEIVAVLPETSPEQGRHAAERLLQAVAGKPVTDGQHEVTVTISVGLAHFPGDDSRDHEALLRNADQALYRAKQDGRNCLRVHGQ